ncbi:hypothetical protein [Streptomyces sp. NPDC057718]|uniref:hypothetical protein n=1 Tax=Streptomyces sp. NPDC057718 TaxID=3346225 RepID=UPI00369B2708
MTGVDVGRIGTLLGSIATYASFPVLVYIAIRGERAAREARRAQTSLDRGVRAETACHELVTASHAFLGVVRKLPSTEAGAREAVLDGAFTLVRRASDTVQFWCSPAAAVAGARVFQCAEQIERRAPHRAVVRSTLSALERYWCPGLDAACDGNAEFCDVSRHWSAFRACELLETWGGMDEWARFEIREELEDVLAASRTLTEEQLVNLRDVLNWGCDWGDFTMRESRWERELREATTVFLDVSRQEYSAASPRAMPGRAQVS